MKLIFNTPDNNHLAVIKKELKIATSVNMAVAFLKNSGLALLKASITEALKRSAKMEFYCGLNFGTTNSTALEELLGLFQKYPNAKLYMVYTKANQTFHPKIWVFQSLSTTKIISGSANFTRGGFESNHECSFISEFKNNDTQVINAFNYFERLKLEKIAREATSLSIAQYGKYEKEQAQKQKGLKTSPPFPEKVTYNLEKLKKWHLRLKKQYVNYNKKRKQNYNEALIVLEGIVNSNLTKNQFIGHYEKLVGGIGIPPLWKSGSIDRHKVNVFEDRSSFKKLVKFISDNRNADAAFVYSNAKKLAEKIKGVGPNIVCEIMMTYNPQEFANINNNPISVLINEAKVEIKKTSQSYSGENYKNYCNIIKEIRADLKLKDMLEVDTFFNEIFQIIKKKLNKKP
ncbi:phospholipase D-like domain-containing protein [Yeosuana sp.]|uniref:phospholipase D-like domain-containing protein n=1 Tax=Yeosuana sp. TaxID=2529388 RepID=UPI004055232E